jgi:hypothetical protein
MCEFLGHVRSYLTPKVRAELPAYLYYFFLSLKGNEHLNKCLIPEGDCYAEVLL